MPMIVQRRRSISHLLRSGGDAIRDISGPF